MLEKETLIPIYPRIHNLRNAEFCNKVNMPTCINTCNKIDCDLTEVLMSQRQCVP